MSAEVVATVTSGNRTHTLTRERVDARTRYTLTTAANGVPYMARTLTRERAMEWAELAKRGETHD